MVSFSVLIITHGREELLIKCLESLRPATPFELILFANGLPLSENVTTYLENYPAQVKLAESKTQLTPGASRNRCVELVTKEWVYLIDDDSYWYPGYWKTVQLYLGNQEMDVLGGPDGPADNVSYFQESVSIALSSPLCTGVTFARHQGLGKTLVSATEEKLTSCNLWIKTALMRKYPFPEDYKRAEETVFLQELQKHRHTMFYHPGIRVGHFRRKNLQALLKPTVGARYWRSRLLRQSDGGGQMFWLPSIFVILHLIIFFNFKLFLELGQLYFAMILPVSMGISSRRKRFWHFPLVAFLHYMIVFLYGTGFLLERAGCKGSEDRR